MNTEEKMCKCGGCPAVLSIADNRLATGIVIDYSCRKGGNNNE